MLGEGPTAISMKALVQEKKSLVLTLVMQRQNFACVCITIVINKEVYKFKADKKKINFLTQFCPRTISDKFNSVESRKKSFKGNEYEYSVNYNATDKSDFLIMQ